MLSLSSDRIKTCLQLQGLPAFGKCNKCQQYCCDLNIVSEYSVAVNTLQIFELFVVAQMATQLFIAPATVTNMGHTLLLNNV